MSKNENGSILNTPESKLRAKVYGKAVPPTIVVISKGIVSFASLGTRYLRDRMSYPERSLFFFFSITTARKTINALKHSRVVFSPLRDLEGRVSGLLLLGISKDAAAFQQVS